MRGFMGLAWDGNVPSVEIWQECLRVLRPGGFLLSFAGTRTQHRMAVNIEDAGFKIRDMIAWLYGSGFPKSKNLEGGRGTALKPAMEPLTVARKPLVGTVEANAATHGTGALNIDGCRIETDPTLDDPRLGGQGTWSSKNMAKNIYGDFAGEEPTSSPLGRWPANVIHDGSDDVLSAFPDAPGQCADAKRGDELKTRGIYGPMKRENEPSADSGNGGVVGFKMKPGARRLDGGSAARFFYCAKASKKDRERGLKAPSGGRANTHPTVKPTDLMRYLVRLVTPPQGFVLDPFAGSGSTGVACRLEGFHFWGIEREAEYVAIANARIAGAHL